MNNLKRILSLALASVMLVGMMVVGASATEFVDDADITHDAAVETMAALNIIGGYAEDNSFRPNVKVTRAQMAKMIAVALNGGKDPVAGLVTGSPFVDVAPTHWAIDYITYCANLGIISGKDPTHYDPEGLVKANEAAKMLLVAIGYDAETFGFTGANWSTNVIRMATTLLIGGTAEKEFEDANSLNLFDGLEGVMADAELTRDQAAQLIYNGIQANGVKMSLTGVTDGKPSYTYSLTGPSILESKFKAVVVTGVLTGVEYDRGNKSTPASWDYTVVDNDGGEHPYTTAIDVSDLFMQQVRVVAKGKNVLSITAAANDAVSTGAFGDLKKTADDDGTVVKLDGYKVDGNDASKLSVYSLETDTKLATNVINYPKSANGHIYDEYRLIDNDSDGSIDCVVVIPVTLTTVSRVAAKAITLVGGSQVAFEGNNIEDGLTQGTYVVVTTAPTGVKTVKAAETMTGKVTGTRTSNKGVTTMRVDGEWYTLADTAEGGQLTAAIATDTLNGHECDLVLVGDLIVAGKAVEEVVNVSDAIMVVTVASQTGSTGGNVDVAAKEYLQIRVLKNDNTTQVLNVIGVRDAAKDAQNEDKAYTPITSDEDKKSNQVKVGEVYTFSEDPDAEGFYNLTKYTGEGYDAANTMTGSITVTKGVAKQGNKSFRFDNDATVFVLAGSKYKVLAGSDVNAWGTTSYATKGANSALYATSTNNGFTYVQLGFLVLDRDSIPGVGADKSIGYGMVTANAVRVLGEDGKYYLNLTIWNGTDEIEVMTTEASANANDTKNYLAGTMVTYTDNNNGTITGLKGINNTLNAVSAFDGVDTIKFAKGAGNEYTITDDTVIVYVDLENGTGADGVIELATPATEDENGNPTSYYGNVWVDTKTEDDTRTVTYLIVDVSGAYVEDGNAAHIIK